MTDTREATPRPWGLCFHLQSAENDASCKCGYRGSIWSACGEYIVCEMGSSPDHDETGRIEGHTMPQAYRHIQLADAALIVRAVNHFDEAVDVLRDLLDRFTTAFPASREFPPIKRGYDLLSKLEADQ